MTRPRILMLGWEFPPAISGGLGVACEGLCRALSGQVELSLILPRSTDSPSIKGVEFIDPYQTKNRTGYSVKLKIAAQADLIPGKLHPYLDSHEHLAPAAHLYGPHLGAEVINFARSAASVADEIDFDLIHAHDWMTSLAAMEIKKRTGKPFILHLHSLAYDRAGPGAGAGGWIYEIEKNAINEADLIVAVSRYTREICIKHYDALPGKVVTIHNCISPVSVFRSQKPFQEKLVLFLGRMTGQKGPEHFLKIAARVMRETTKVRFVMAGSGDQLKSLMAQSTHLGIENHIHFTGFLERKNVHRLLSMTDVFCMPSVSEPFGLSALEAAQFGIPGVISRQSGVIEVLPHARTADSWDTSLMAKHIIDLITNDELHQQASRAAQKDQKNISWDQAATRLTGQYRRVIDSY